MRQLMFVIVMSTILTPLAIFQTDDPFRKMGRMPKSVEKVEAVQVVTQQARRLYGRVENTIAQRVDGLADYYFGD